MSLPEALLEYGQHAAGWGQASGEAPAWGHLCLHMLSCCVRSSVIAVHKHNQRLPIGLAAATPLPAPGTELQYLPPPAHQVMTTQDTIWYPKNCCSVASYSALQR